MMAEIFILLLLMKKADYTDKLKTYEHIKQHENIILKAQFI